MSWLEQRWYSTKPAPLWLRPLEKLFCTLAKRKKQRDTAVQWHAPVPVVIVGNISAGGTGKTPLTVHLLELLQQQGYRPGVISRGYKSKAPYYPFDLINATTPEQSGDEPYMLYKRCGCPVVIDADRTAAAKYLLQQYDCDLLISDDGLQHYRLGRDIEIAVVDGSRGLGNGHCLPAGPLREGEERLTEVDFVVVNGEVPEGLPSQLPLYPMQLQATAFKEYRGQSIVSVEQFEPQAEVHAVAGIGNPQRFFNTLDTLLTVPVICHPKPDHHDYQPEDFNFPAPATILMTEKDAVKVADLNLNDAWYLEVSARLPDNFDTVLLAQLKQIIKVKGKRDNG